MAMMFEAGEACTQSRGERRLVFDQQPREGSKAYEAFRTYLEMGPERSLVKTAKDLGKTIRLIESWSRKWGWQARVQAHGAHLAEIERKAAEALATRNGVDWAKRQEEHREDEWQTRGELIALAREAIDRWKKTPARCGTLEGIARLLDLASKLGRVSSGLALEPEDKPKEEDAAFMIQIDVALEKIYGPNEPKPLPVVEVEEVSRKDAKTPRLGKEIGDAVEARAGQADVPTREGL
jgi:hypothetical protein